MARPCPPEHLGHEKGHSGRESRGGPAQVLARAAKLHPPEDRPAVLERQERVHGAEHEPRDRQPCTVAGLPNERDDRSEERHGTRCRSGEEQSGTASVGRQLEQDDEGHHAGRNPVESGDAGLHNVPTTPDPTRDLHIEVDPVGRPLASLDNSVAQPRWHDALSVATVSGGIGPASADAYAENVAPHDRQPDAEH